MNDVTRTGKPQVERLLVRVWLASLMMSLVCVSDWVRAAQPSKIVIGFTAPLSGPDASFGLGLKHGVELALARANASGGANGRLFELVALNDGGDPLLAAANARQLLQQGAIAITGVHGARSALSVAEVLSPKGGAAQAALVAPATGADALRDPPRPGVFHLRAGMAEEAAAAALHLDTLGVTRYAVLAQRDAFGDSGHERVLNELTRMSIVPVAVERVPQGVDLRSAMDKICTAGAEAVIVALEAEAAVTAVMLARARPSCATHYLVFSETGAALARRGSDGGVQKSFAGVLVTQVVPHPNNLNHPLIAEYRQALATAGNASYPSVEGYMAMRVLQEVMRSCSRDPDRSCVLQTLSTRSFELPGLRAQFNTANRQVRPFVEITLLDAQGRFRR